MEILGDSFVSFKVTAVVFSEGNGVVRLCQI